LSKVKKFLQGIARGTSLDVVRGYLTKRIRAISVDDIIEAIESDDTDVLSKMSEKERAIFETVSRKYGKYASNITVRDVMEWLIEDAPFHAGVIYGHPKGLKWLEKVVSQLRDYAVRVYSQANEVELELVPEFESSSGEATKP